MITTKLNDAFILKHFPNNVVPKGWSVTYDETRRGFDPIRPSLLEAMCVGVCEMLGGAAAMHFPISRLSGKLEIPETKIERGGVFEVTYNAEKKTVFIEGYFSGGTFADK